MTDFGLGLILKPRLFGTRKWFSLAKSKGGAMVLFNCGRLLTRIRDSTSLAKSKSGAMVLFNCGRLLTRILDSRLVEGYKPLLC